MDRESKIREYLKTLDYVDIANSTFLFGVDFDNDSIEHIMAMIMSLYINVKNLKSIIDRNFKPVDGELLPKDPTVQAMIIRDYYAKESALNKVLNNDDVYTAFIDFAKKEHESSHLGK